MTWDGAGNHDRIHNFSADASAGIQAQAARFDAEFDDISTALENCQTLTGETTPTADSPMGGFKHTGVAVATSTDNYLRADQQAQQTAIYVRDVNTGATGGISASAAVFPTAFSDGQRVTVKVSGSASASAPMVIRINGLSANIVDNSASAVPSRYLFSNGIYDLVYDSSAAAFKMLNTLIPADTITVRNSAGFYTGSDVETILDELGPQTTRVVGVVKATAQYRADQSASTTALYADTSLAMSLSVGAMYNVTGQIVIRQASAGAASNAIQYRFLQDGVGNTGHYIADAVGLGVSASTSTGDVFRKEAYNWNDTATASILSGTETVRIVPIDGIYGASTTARAAFQLYWAPTTSTSTSCGVDALSWFKAEKLT